MKLVVIAGATATGKSALSVSLAEAIDAEVINADSMQVYRGMDIGTAKISIEERRGVVHHMRDVLDVNQDSNVAWYQGARAAVLQCTPLCNAGDGERAMTVNVCIL